MANEDGLGAGRRRTGPHRDTDHVIDRMATNGVGATAKGSEAREAAPDRPDDLPSPYPQRIARKYYVAEGPAQTGERRVFADARGEYLAFKDEGHRLTTQREEATVVRDVVAIAQHREWSAVRVTGSEAFRREVWLEATTRGITVSGYEPTALDQAAQARRRADLERRSAHRTRGRDATVEREPQSVVSATSGREARSADGARRPQDADQGSDRLAPSGPVRREVVAHPNLAAAQSHLIMLDRALRRALPDHKATREAVLQVARERLAMHLREGRTLRRAAYSRPARERASDRSGPGNQIELHRNRQAQREPLER